MKKSELYKVAQLAVLRDVRIPEDEKLEIIRELQDREYTETLFEERRAQEAAENAESV
jgi:hypothetical protein